MLAQTDLNELLARVDLDALVERVDMNLILEGVDIDSLIEQTHVGLVGRSLRAARRPAGWSIPCATHGIDLDTWLNRQVDRILRRKAVFPTRAVRPCFAVIWMRAPCD